MKRRIAILASFMVVIFLCSTAYGATNEVIDGMAKKLFRGTVNILTGWLELPSQAIKGYNSDKYEDNKLAGLGVGLIKGVGYAVGRTAWGAVELAGFWTANPEDNNGIGILLDDEYVWQEGTPYDCFEPNFTEATLKPIGNKLTRGLSNSIFGVLEVPGQFVKGFKDKAPDLGIVKGLWFWCSREIYGVGDLATVIFPIPEDNPGYPLDQEYPWDAFGESAEK